MARRCRTSSSALTPRRQISLRASASFSAIDLSWSTCVMDDPKMTSSDADRTLLRDQAARFASQHAGLGLLGRAAAGADSFDAAVQASVWSSLLTLEALGGSGLGLADMVPVAEEIGRRLL